MRQHIPVISTLLQQYGKWEEEKGPGSHVQLDSVCGTAARTREEIASKHGRRKWPTLKTIVFRPPCVSLSLDILNKLQVSQAKGEVLFLMIIYVHKSHAVIHRNVVELGSQPVP